MNVFAKPEYDWLRRGLRTFFQGFIGILLVLAVPILNDLINGVSSGEDAVIDVGLWRNIGIAAVAGGFVALVAAGQNLAEQKTSFPAIFKGKATSGQNPVPDPNADPR